MKEFIEKLISRLEEEKNVANNTYINYELNVDLGRVFGLDKAIEIVNQLAEEYKTCYKSCTDCEAYDKEKHHCPKFCYIIEETVKEIEENHNGWIPCSKLPEEDGVYLCKVFHADDYVVWIMRFNNGEFLRPDDVENLDYELIEWKYI